MRVEFVLKMYSRANQSPQSISLPTTPVLTVLTLCRMSVGPGTNYLGQGARTPGLNIDCITGTVFDPEMSFF